MNKRIINFLMVLVGCGAITGSCKKEDNGVPFTYTSQVIVGTNGSLDGANTTTSNASKYQIELLFSADGSTFGEYPKLSPGQKYWVKLYHGALSENLSATVEAHALSYDPGTAFDFDWSGSNPQPNGSATGDVAEFTLTGKNFVQVNVVDHHCATDLSIFADGSGWVGPEGVITHSTGGVAKANLNGSTDLSQFTVDPLIPNRLWMTNFFGDGTPVKVYMDFTTSTSYTDQLVNVPSQTTSEGGVAVGSGMYDQCRQKLVLNVSYTFPGADVYKWTYNFTKGPYCNYDASSWVATWVGDEGTNTRSCGSSFTGSKDDNVITQDPSVANRFHMDNFWGDGVDAYFDMNPATNFWSQTLSIPAQTTSEGGTIAAGTGTFDQCAGTFNLKCSYTIGGCTYKWTYSFAKK